MFAPVVMRFNSYAPALSDAARAYAGRVTALPAVQAWIDGARDEASKAGESGR
jgi:glutathione S-transferase